MADDAEQQPEVRELTEEIAAQGLSQVARTADGEGYAFVRLELPVSARMHTHLHRCHSLMQCNSNEASRHSGVCWRATHTCERWTCMAMR